MKHFEISSSTWAAIAGVILIFALGSAQAVTITGNYDVSLNDQDPGLVINTSDAFENPFTFGLFDNDSKTIELFDIWRTLPRPSRRNPLSALG